MSWSTISANQGVTFSNLKNAVDTGVLSAIQTIPNTNELVTKAEASSYVNVDLSINSLAIKTNNQIVVKNDLTALAGTPAVTTCVSNCQLIIRNESGVAKSLQVYSPGDGTCRGNYNFTVENIANNTEQVFTNNWRTGAMLLDLTAVSATRLIVEYSINGGTSYSLLVDASLPAGQLASVNSISVPNIAGYRLRVRMIPSFSAISTGFKVMGSKPSASSPNYMLWTSGVNNTIDASYAFGGPGIQTTTCTETSFCNFSANCFPYPYLAICATPVRALGVSYHSPLNPLSDLIECYFNQGENNCGVGETQLFYFRQALSSNAYTPISVQPRLNAQNNYIIAPLYTLTIHLSAALGTLIVEYDLYRLGYRWFTNLRPFTLSTTTTCTNLGSITLREGDEVRIRLKTPSGGLVSYVFATGTTVCPSSGTPTCQGTFIINANTTLAIRPQVSAGTYVGCQ